MKIVLSDEDLAHTRFTFSPLTEAVTSYVGLLHPRRTSPPPLWTDRVRRATSRVDVGALSSLLAPCPAIFDFLALVPGEPGPGIDDELEVLRTTTPETIEAEISEFYRSMGPEPPDQILPFLRRPQHALYQLVEALRRYWSVALAPQWEVVRPLLEAELLSRGRQVATAGPRAALGDLHPLVRWEQGGLQIESAHRCDQLVAPRGAGAVVFITAFAWSGVFAGTLSDGRAVLAYSPPGIAEALVPQDARPGRALEALLGEARAALLRQLTVPRSTTEVARRLWIGPSTVSYHLTHLRAAGLVDRLREGHVVYYRLTPLGRTLLWVWGAPPSTPAPDG